MKTLREFLGLKKVYLSITRLFNNWRQTNNNVKHLNTLTKICKKMIDGNIVSQRFCWKCSIWHEIKDIPGGTWYINKYNKHLLVSPGKYRKNLEQIMHPDITIEFIRTKGE